MKKLFEISVLILYLFIIEHLLFPILVFTSGFVVKGTSISITETDLRLIYQLFVIRIVLWSIPLIIIFIVVISNINLRNILFLAILNVMSNMIIVGLVSATWFELIETESVYYIPVITFVSPFILNTLPFSKRWIQAAIGSSS